MTETSDHLHTIIDISKLPSLPQTLIELIDMCQSSDRDLTEIAALIARDASISARILQLANSAFIGARNTFADIEQAVIYLGIDTVRNLAISVSVHETFGRGDRFGNLDLSSFWYHSFLTAILAKSFAQTQHYANPAEAYLTGLLHDVGKLLLLTSFPEQYPEILEQEHNGNMLPVFEKGNLGITHAEATSLLVSQWNLEQRVTDAVFGHHDDLDEAAAQGPLGRILYCANRLSNSLALDYDGPADTLAGRFFGFDQSALKQLAENATAEVDRVTTEMSIKVSPGPLIREGSAKSGLKNRLSLARKVQAISTIGGAVDNLLKAENLNRVVRIVEESLHILFNIPYCLLLLPDLRSAGFRIQVSTSNRHHGTEELTIPVELDTTGIIGDCLKTNTICHGASTDSLKFGVLESQCSRLLETDELLTVPIPLEDRNRGVLVIGISSGDAPAVKAQGDTLSLLAGQIGMRIRLERLQQKSEAERIAALAAIARRVALEINGPTVAIQRRLAALQARADGAGEDCRDLAAINRELTSISDIAAQLTDLSMVESPSEGTRVEINPTITAIAETHRQTLPARPEIAIELELDPDLPTITTDLSGLERITGHLIKNSLEAMSTGGVLKISTSRNSDELLITVEDTGPGTPPELADEMFTAGVSTKGSGHVGLGLAISRKLVQELGGAISYASSQQAGSRFTVSLPLHP